jgi:hypothetical protein
MVCFFRNMGVSLVALTLVLSLVGCGPTTSSPDKMGGKMDGKMNSKMDDKMGGKMDDKMDDKMGGKMSGKMDDKK